MQNQPLFSKSAKIAKNLNPKSYDLEMIIVQQIKSNKICAFVF